MNQKLEAAANEFTHKVGLKFLARRQHSVAIDSFKAGAAYGRKEALMEAIEICRKDRELYVSNNRVEEIMSRLEQLLSKDE